MFYIVEKYINGMSLYDLQNFAIANDVYLSNDELDFCFKFVKSNWKSILSKYSDFDIKNYKDKFSDENYNKISKLIEYYKNKYSIFLK
ncbi:MAG: hypothetical protein ACI4WW_04050 [Candidatus Coprovivens sp.]